MSLSDYQLATMVEVDDLDEIILLPLDDLVAKKKKVERAYNKRIRS